MADTSVIESERDQVIRELTRHCGDGRLTLDELEERIEAAHRASTSDELRLLLRDLPAARVEPPVAETPPRPRPVVTPTARPRIHPPHVPQKHDHKRPEGPIGVAITIAGFVLLFNGFFWWALAVWFLLPGILKSVHRT